MNTVHGVWIAICLESKTVTGPVKTGHGLIRSEPAHPTTIRRDMKAVCEAKKANRGAVMAVPVQEKCLRV